MIKGKAIDIIKTFSQEELKDFRSFVESPYFNRKKKITELFTIIENNLDTIDEADLSEEQFFINLFDNGKFSYSYLKNLTAELLRLCEIFLVISKLKAQQFRDDNSERVLLSELNTRFLDKQFSIKLKDIRENFADRKIDSDYFASLGKIEGENIAFYLYRSSMHKVPDHLMKRVESNFLYILQLIEHDLMDVSVNEAAFNFKFDNAIVPDLIKSIDIKKMLSALSMYEGSVRNEIEIHLRLILLGNGRPDDENYRILKKLLIPGIDRYTNAEKFNMFVRLKNYCAFRIYEGERTFYNEKYSLLKEELASVKYNQDGVGPLYANIFLETVQSAINEDELDYAESVINDFSESIEESKKDNISNLAVALLMFEKKSFEKSLDHLNLVNPLNTMMRLISKMLMVKIFYELREEQSCSSALESFKHYINTAKEITGGRRKNLSRNYAIMRRLYRAKFLSKSFPADERQMLINEIEDSETRYGKWYIEKVNEFADRQ